MNAKQMEEFRKKMKAAAITKKPTIKVLGLGQSKIALSENSKRKRVSKFQELKKLKGKNSVTNLIDFNNITENTDFNEYTIITVDKLSIITKTANVKKILKMDNTLYYHLTRQLHVTKTEITEKLVTNKNRTYHRISVPYNFIINDLSYKKIMLGLKTDKMNVITIEKTKKIVNILPSNGNGPHEIDVPLYIVKNVESI